MVKKGEGNEERAGEGRKMVIQTESRYWTALAIKSVLMIVLRPYTKTRVKVALMDCRPKSIEAPSSSI